MHAGKRRSHQERGKMRLPLFANKNIIWCLADTLLTLVCKSFKITIACWAGGARP